MSAQAPCVAVAYSGGCDSSALLHATLAVAQAQGFAVVALHVHHGLSPHADEWLAHCERLCGRWRRRGRPIVFDARRLAGRPARGESVEAWARRGRYAALREMALAHGARLVLLAHHAQDQAETFLLQALRGAGAAGLAAMPRRVQRDGVTWARPWLHRDPARIAAYARRHRLRHVEDDSNADPRFARNRLRAAVWPALERAFPQAAASLAASATHAHEARVCADALAALDLAQCAPDGPLDIGTWSRLEPQERRSNALRAWLLAHTGMAPAASLVARLLAELAAKAPAQWPCAGQVLRRYRGRLQVAARTPAGRDAPLEGEFPIARCGVYRAPGWGGSLVVRRVATGGIDRACLPRLQFAARRGGEQFQSAPGRPARSLKKCFQAIGVPAWQRAAPLVYAAGQLLYVPGLGIDARALAPAGTAQVALEWRADDA